MKRRALLALSFLILSSHSALIAQAKSIAITVNNRGKFPDQQNLIASNLVSKLAGRPDLTVIDNERVEEILRTQNQQNSDRYSPESAARIGRLVGASILAVVQVEYFTFTVADKNSGFGNSSKIGTATLRTTVRLINVESGVILAQPVADFHNSAVLTQVNNNALGSILAKRPINSTTGDAASATVALAAKAIDTVSDELSSKILDSVHLPGEALAAAPLAPSLTATVAGISNGAVYINKGSESGIHAGDRFNIVRTVELSLKDPQTGKPLTSKKTVCTLVIRSIDDGNSSGSCDGGLPQSGDAAQSLPR